MNTLKLSIATPNGEVYSSDEIKMVNIETYAGSIGIMAKHEPIVTTLKIGILKIIDKNNKIKYFAISKGFAEAHGNEVNIMVQTAEEASVIDKNRAEKSMKRAEERLSNKDNIDLKRAEISLKRALNRLKAANLK